MAIRKLERAIILTTGLIIASSLNAQKVKKGYPLKDRLNSYKQITLTTDTSELSDAERKCIVHLIKAAEHADNIFWMQSYMSKDEALKGIKDPDLKQFIKINYGPWDRLNNDEPFVASVGAKTKGVNFYPDGFDPSQVMEDMKFRVFDPYTVVYYFDPKDAEKYQKMGQMPPPRERFPTLNGKEIEIESYSMVYQKELIPLTEALRAASEAIQEEDPKFAEYLIQRIDALFTNDYIISDISWLNLNSHLDIIIGPIENYEDKLTGSKTSFEAYVLVRDREWGAKLEKYVALLPELQAGLPVEEKYKPSLGPNVSETETVEPTIDENGNVIEEAVGEISEIIEIEGFPPVERPEKPMSQLAVFDAIYYAGDCNSGSKTIAVNLPNHEVIQEYFGTRRSQLKNTMKAKFDEIVVPISEKVIHPSQRKKINFNAFFSNVMFHEVAHGLGIKNLIDNQDQTVREALGATYSAIEECKADVLGLYMVTKLIDMKELDGDLEDFYVTFVASVYRSVRFGASSAHGKANMITFNTLMNSGCLESTNKGMKVDVAKMRSAIESLAAELLILQGDGNVDGVNTMLSGRGKIGDSLKTQIDGLNAANIPVDIVFDQGIRTLGLEKYAEEAADSKGERK